MDATAGDRRLDHVALVADGLKVDGGMYCREGFAAQGEVRLPGAQLGVQLSFDGAKLSDEGGSALVADGLKVDGGMYCQEGFAPRARCASSGRRSAASSASTGRT